MDDITLKENSPEVNYERSIKRQWLVYENGVFGITGGIFYFFVYIFFISMAVLLAYTAIDHHPMAITDLILPVFVIGWLLSNIAFNNSLVKIKGKDMGSNKENILFIIDKKFSGYNFIINDEKMMRSFTPVENPIWGRIITILFDGELIYLNITTIGKTNSTTMIHGLYNYFKAKKIARYYLQNLA